MPHSPMPFRPHGSSRRSPQPFQPDEPGAKPETRRDPQTNKPQSPDHRRMVATAVARTRKQPCRIFFFATGKPDRQISSDGASWPLGRAAATQWQHEAAQPPERRTRSTHLATRAANSPAPTARHRQADLKAIVSPSVDHLSSTPPESTIGTNEKFSHLSSPEIANTGRKPHLGVAYRPRRSRGLLSSTAANIRSAGR